MVNRADYRSSRILASECKQIAFERVNNLLKLLLFRNAKESQPYATAARVSHRRVSGLLVAHRLASNDCFLQKATLAI